MTRAALALALALALASLLAACGGGDSRENRTQACLDPATLQIRSVCMSAGCCDLSTLEADAD
jgi:hypothetical protein